MKVTKEIKKLENSAVELTATISKEDVKAGYDEQLKNIAKNIQLPGFRKGHVPFKTIESKYGEALKAEIAGDLIDKALNELMNQEENFEIRPLPYSQPMLDKMPEFDLEKDLTFTVKYDVFPAVEVKNFDGITIKEPQVEIGKKEIEEELKAIQDRNATVLDKKDGDKVAKDDIVTINYKELNDDDSTVAGSEREGFVFTVGTGENIYKIDDEITGMAKNETKVINKEIDGAKKKISVTVTAVKVRQLPALDDDLAQDVSDKFKTLDDLKADISKNLENAKNRKLAEIKSQDLLNQLVEKNPVELPASMLKAELSSRFEMMAQQFQTTPEQLEKMIEKSGQTKEAMLKEWTGDSEKMLKSRLIVDTLIREKNISVTPEEIEAEYAKLAEDYGMAVEEVKKQYSDARSKEYLMDEVKERKLFEELYKQVKVTKGDKKSFADLFQAK